VPVTDLVVKGHDLVVATQGRSFWILDDIAPLRQMKPALAAADVHLFAPSPAMRFFGGGRPQASLGQNPPSGAVFYYFLKTEPKQTEELALEILDASGKLIRRITSQGDPEAEKDPSRPEWEPPPPKLPARAGLNRFAWDLRHEPAGRFKGLLAGKKFILLSRQAHVRGKAREALNDLLGASRKLLKAHLLKESFNHLWTYKSKTCARRFLDGWKDQLKWSRLKPYHKFARMVEAHFDGILACCDKRVSLGYIEATNLKAKNLIRRAYGFRDKEYMRLKIIQACSPWMGEFRPWGWVHAHNFLS